MRDMRIGAMQARNQRPDTAADIARRRRATAISEQVSREVEERFPVITEENVHAALDFQSARFKALAYETGATR